MAFDDLHLDRPGGADLGAPARGPDSPSPLRWVVVALAGVAAGAGLTFWWMSRDQPTTATPAPTTATDVAIESNRPKRQPMDLPSLDASDTLLRDLVAMLSQNPQLARLLATPSLVRGATSAVVQIGDGRTPVAPLQTLRPATRLQITGTGSGRLDARSYPRWTPAVAALTSISPADAAQLYVNTKPLFDQAYIELGHPGGDFDTAIARAIVMLDDVPASAGEPSLIRRSNFFEHEDAALRALPPVQKQFLLIGPENRKEVMTWLKRFAQELELRIE